MRPVLIGIATGLRSILDLISNTFERFICARAGISDFVMHLFSMAACLIIYRTSLVTMEIVYAQVAMSDSSMHLLSHISFHSSAEESVYSQLSPKDLNHDKTSFLDKVQIAMLSRHTTESDIPARAQRTSIVTRLFL